jgi:hypothetical protein
VRVPGRYATVRWHIWQRVTGSWVTVTGKRREGDLLICFNDARPAAVIVSRVFTAYARHAADEDSGHVRSIGARKPPLGGVLG